MPIRCKLISPTNLLLEHPLRSPVDDAEFIVLGSKEFLRIGRQLKRESFYMGLLAGCALATAISLAVHIWMVWNQ